MKPDKRLLFTLLLILLAGIASSVVQANANAIKALVASSDTDALDYTIVDTGQAACYDDTGVEIACPAEGEAFYGQDSQFADTPADYTDIGDGTVSDNLTGLMWQQTPPTTRFNWPDAVDYCSSLTLGGHTDWRVPNIKELQSIIDYSGVYPAIDPTYFNISDEDAYFWSSTSAYFSPVAPGYYYAWNVAFGYAVDAEGIDSHGAGAVRFDTKLEGGPAGEEPERIYNYVRLVRNVYSSPEEVETSYLPQVFK